ncbi:hypothetical protein [Streptomyces noursei]
MRNAARLQLAASPGHAQGVDGQVGAVVVGPRVADDLRVARSSQQAR